VNKEGLDCLITWRDMKVVSFSKILNFSDEFATKGAHPLIDTNPDDSSWHVMPRLQRRCHDVALTIEHELYFERRRRETQDFLPLSFESTWENEINQEFTCRRLLAS
jgi:hypothetical protein